jgi:hypothetical protein
MRYPRICPLGCALLLFRCYLVSSRELRIQRKAWSVLVVAVIAGIAIGASVFIATQQHSRCADACPPTGEALALSELRVNSPTNITIWLQDVGTLQVVLVSYYVNNSSSHQYANTSWQGPRLAPGSSTTVDLLINGAPFTFQQGNRYTMEVASSDNLRWTGYFIA